jgi:hypothetical protein
LKCNDRISQGDECERKQQQDAWQNHHQIRNLIRLITHVCFLSVLKGEIIRGEPPPIWAAAHHIVNEGLLRGVHLIKQRLAA